MAIWALFPLSSPLQGGYSYLLSPAHFQADKWLLNEREKTLLPSLCIPFALLVIKDITYLLPQL